MTGIRSHALMRRDLSSGGKAASAGAVSLAIVAAAFVVSRLVFHIVGVRFDMTSLDWYWQYIDPVLLKNRLLESTYYLHSQPPLFNLFMGSVIKLFPGREAAAFALAYKTMGLALAISIYLLMRNLRITNWIALPMTLAFILSPSSIIFESWLFYDYPLVTLLCVSAVLLHKAVSSRGTLSMALFFSCLAMAVLLRSMFHMVWFLLFAVILIVRLRRDRRRVIIACLIPLAVVISLYVKTALLFGSFTSSTWFGMSFGKMTTFKISEDERRDLIERGEISRLAAVRPFSSMDAYKEHVSLPTKTGIPVLDEERKTGGHPRFNTNFNNRVFVDISKQYLRDALRVLGTHPVTYLKTVALSFGIYFFPSSDYIFFEGNRSRIDRLDQFYDRVLYGQIVPHGGPAWGEERSDGSRTQRLSHMGFFLIVGFGVFVLYGWHRLRQAWRRPESDAFLLTLLFIYINVIYVTLVGNCVEIGENNRFRFIIDPFILTGLALFLNALFKRSGRRRIREG
jgi:hypothetical protein